MIKNIRTSLLAAAAAVAISATTAAAALPTWFESSDRNQDSRVSWSEFVRQNSNFDRLDENGDGKITSADYFLLDGREESSLIYVEYLDANSNRVVSLTEYNQELRAAFASYDRNGNGSISSREVDDARPARGLDARRIEGRDGAARRGARS